MTSETVSNSIFTSITLLFLTVNILAHMNLNINIPNLFYLNIPYGFICLIYGYKLHTPETLENTLCNCNFWMILSWDVLNLIMKCIKKIIVSLIPFWKERITKQIFCFIIGFASYMCFKFSLQYNNFYEALMLQCFGLFLLHECRKCFIYYFERTSDEIFLIVQYVSSILFLLINISIILFTCSLEQTRTRVLSIAIELYLYGYYEIYHAEPITRFDKREFDYLFTLINKIH